MAGQVLISGQLTGVAAASYINIGPFTIAGNSANNFQVNSVTLASGANTVTVPTWAVGCIINPNVTNTTGLTLKGVTGDTGVALDPSGPTLLNFPATTPASFVLTAASLFSTVTEVIFF